MHGIGLSLPNRGILFGAITVPEMLELAEYADNSDYFDSVWVGDGLLAKPRLESVVSLAAISARTTRVKLGVCCLATFPLRQPVLFATQWASLDVVSGGRTILAVCLGATTARSGTNVVGELQAMGVKGSERVPRLEESIQLIRRLWDGPTSADGDFWSFPEVDLQPKPVQNPCPIWIASNPNPSKLPPHRFAAAIDRVGRLADGWQSTMITPEEFGQRWDEVRERAEFHGRDSRAMSSAVHLMINLDDDVAAARAEAKRFLDVYYSIDATDEVLDRWGAYGPTETVLKRLGQYTDRGLDVPILRFASFRQSEQMERATTELLPELAKQQTQVTQ